VLGPIAPIIPFETEDEAIALANDTRYGLNAMLFTESLNRAHRVAAALRAGTVWATASSSATSGRPSAVWEIPRGPGGRQPQPRVLH
jgi:acyl-CoA reductase-like NAD-dependent aldehyde dehydrogenase